MNYQKIAAESGKEIIRNLPGVSVKEGAPDLKQTVNYE
jgi:hypothetical protein